jgi:hypothetical protein
VVPLLLILFSLQISQVVDLIQIVKAVPVRIKFELPRVKLLHRPAVRHGHAGEAEGNLPLPGIFPQGLQHRLQRPMARGEEVHTVSIKMGKHHQIALHKSGMLTPPQV